MTFDENDFKNKHFLNENSDFKANQSTGLLFNMAHYTNYKNYWYFIKNINLYLSV